MKINVPHVAKLANLAVRPDEIKKFEQQLSSILDYIKKLAEVNTDKVIPTSQTTGLEDVFREDVAAASLTQAEVVSGAKVVHHNFFQVKGIFEDE